MDELFTFKEAAEFLKISEKTFIKVLQENNVPSRKLGNQWRFSKQALIQWIGEGNSKDFTNSAR